MTTASITALMTALIRAVHSRRDPAPLFHDPYGDRFLTDADRGLLRDRFLAMLDDGERARVDAVADPAEMLARAVEANPAFGGVVLRSRWSEDCLFAAAERGIRRYILVGAGFDSFAWRRPSPGAGLDVVEIDTPGTLAAKRERAAAAGLAVPGGVQMIAADLEREGAGPALARIAEIGALPSFVACLGVLPYLTAGAVQRLLASIAAGVAAGSEVVFDYLEPQAGTAADPALQRVRSGLAAAGGEAWRSGLTPDALPAQLHGVGLALLEDVDGRALQSRYAAGRTLTVPGRLHVARARVAEH
jgi:methyltransferase (TIGR00027 family)